MKNYFPENLKFLRIQKGLTQYELAKKMGKDYSTIGKWELGQRNPIMSDVIKLSDIFNVSVQDLVEKKLKVEADKKDEIELLFNKHKNELTDSDKLLIKTIIEQRQKENEGRWKSDI